MREILFRAKSKAYGEWLYGVPYYSEELWWLIVDANTCSDEFGTGSYNIIPETVGQYIGLKDRNGVKIFEGDIFSDGSICVMFKTRIVKVWASGDWEDLDLTETKDVIIGNIHDNPELLEVE